jgi:sec-independent protein translocase protein TatA
MPFGIQPLHIIVIIIVALLIFGPKRLPEIGKSLAHMLNELRNGIRGMSEGFREESQKTAAPPAATAPAAESPLPPPDAPAPPTPASAENFCTQCGAANPADARFCNKCGVQLPR